MKTYMMWCIGDTKCSKYYKFGEKNNVKDFSTVMHIADAKMFKSRTAAFAYRNALKKSFKVNDIEVYEVTMQSP